ncbi:hypothetical protein ABT354_37960, partial [Streptomyces sp. NPDC000594]|uniref:hypothetical protein n=1 Tax=Streptomyces sp. NPDC000594 TaxID=3154261 RepID=UPI00331F7FEB
NAVALRACGWGSGDEDGLGAGAGRLRPGTVLGSPEVVVGHLAFDDTGLAAEPSDGKESFQEILLQQHQRFDQEVRGKKCPV